VAGSLGEAKKAVPGKLETYWFSDDEDAGRDALFRPSPMLIRASSTHQTARAPENSSLLANLDARLRPIALRKGTLKPLISERLELSVFHGIKARPGETQNFHTSWAADESAAAEEARPKISLREMRSWGV
jgi:hypothetical protein